MRDKKDVLVEGSDYRISLMKLTGKKIKDIEGYVSTAFCEPVFLLCAVVFDDGSKFGCEGEHDLPYLTDYDDQTTGNLDKLSKDEVNDEKG